MNIRFFSLFSEPCLRISVAFEFTLGYICLSYLEVTTKDLLNTRSRIKMKDVNLGLVLSTRDARNVHAFKIIKEIFLWLLPLTIYVLIGILCLFVNTYVLSCYYVFDGEV
ncbi:hypothetical protein A4A49_23708 [Nicotiana attenuata]|uniref:Uncharacterized protein n=1 Tax=Nicotiana attenuata TaxID=49451 RepID=A0A314L0W2_NICAT|nr:hypothetical protein A4A49_23708 [Nicotiana attenuata]